jgi:hypothetical protein
MRWTCVCRTDGAHSSGREKVGEIVQIARR